MNAGRRREDVGDDSAVRKLARRRKGELANRSNAARQNTELQKEIRCRGNNESRQ